MKSQKAVNKLLDMSTAMYICNSFEALFFLGKQEKKMDRNEIPFFFYYSLKTFMPVHKPIYIFIHIYRYK